MRRVYWSILIGLIILIGGLILGIGGLLLAPLLGIIVIVGIVLWLAERKAEHKRPAD